MKGGFDYRQKGEYVAPSHEAKKESENDFGDTRIITLDTLSSAQKGFGEASKATGFQRFAFSKKTKAPTKTEIEKPIPRSALENFQSYISSIDGESKKREEIIKLFEQLDFEETLAFVGGEVAKIDQVVLEKIKEITEEQRAFKSTVELIRTGVESVCKRSVSSFNVAMNHIFTEFINFATGDKDILLCDITTVQNTFNEALSEIGGSRGKKEVCDQLFDKMIECFDKLSSEENTGDLIEEAEKIIDSVKTLFESIFQDLINEVERWAHRNDDEIILSSVAVESDLAGLVKICLFGAGSEMEIYRKAFEEIRNMPIEIEKYRSQLGEARTENKLRILLGLERLFSLARGEDEGKKIVSILTRLEAEHTGRRVCEDSQISDALFSEAEIRALRIYFVHLALSIPNATESFIHKEIEEIIGIYKDLEGYSISLEVLSNRILARIRGAMIPNNLKKLFLEQLMETEYGLVVRDKFSGFSLGSFEEMRCFDGNGRWYLMQSEQKLEPNYDPIIPNHDRVGKTVFGLAKRKFTTTYENRNTDGKKYHDFRSFVDSLAGDEQDLEMALVAENNIVDISFHRRNVYEILAAIEQLVNLAAKDNIDNKGEIMGMFLELSELIKNEKGFLGLIGKITYLFESLSAERKAVLKLLEETEHEGTPDQSNNKNQEIRLLMDSFEKNLERTRDEVADFAEKLEILAPGIYEPKPILDTLISVSNRIKEVKCALQKSDEIRDETIGDIVFQMNSLEKDLSLGMRKHGEMTSQIEIPIRSVFESIDSLLGLLGYFSPVEIRSLKFMFLNSLIPAGKLGGCEMNEDFLIEDWPFETITPVYEAKIKYEDLLAGFLPYLDRVKAYIRVQQNISPDFRFFLENQLEVAEWKISGRIQYAQKDTVADPFLNEIWRKSAEAQKRRYEEATKPISLDECDDSGDFEPIVLDDEVEDGAVVQPETDANNDKNGFTPSDEYFFNSGADLNDGTGFDLEENASIGWNFPRQWTQMAVLAVLMITAGDVGSVLNKGQEQFEQDQKQESLESGIDVFSRKSEIEKKYESGELVYRSENENDKFGYFLLSKFWKGIDSVEEAESFYQLIDQKTKAEVNAVLKSMLSTKDLDLLRSEFETTE